MSDFAALQKDHEAIKAEVNDLQSRLIKLEFSLLADPTTGRTSIFEQVNTMTQKMNRLEIQNWLIITVVASNILGLKIPNITNFL